VWISASAYLLFCGSTALRVAPSIPSPIFHDRLGRHFERKIARVSMASTLGTIAIAPI
jgi:hypothetical protein